jgi:hypothetical protein
MPVMESEYAQRVEDYEALQLKVWLYERMKIEDNATKGLALTQRERLLKITEAWDYSGDADAYGNSLTALRNQLFPRKLGTSVDEGGYLPEHNTSSDALINAAMAQIGKHLRN